MFMGTKIPHFTKKTILGITPSSTKCTMKFRFFFWCFINPFDSLPSPKKKAPKRSSLFRTGFFFLQLSSCETVCYDGWLVGWLWWWCDHKQMHCCTSSSSSSIISSNQCSDGVHQGFGVNAERVLNCISMHKLNIHTGGGWCWWSKCFPRLN